MKTAKEIIIETLQGEGLMYAYRDFADDIKDEHIEKIADKIVKNLNIPAIIKSVCHYCGKSVEPVHDSELKADICPSCKANWQTVL